MQRGHNREPCKKEDCALRAYALMINHVHLLVWQGNAECIPRIIIALGRRTGMLWDSRYKYSLIQAETYLLACQRYIELNPVCAAMVEYPATYCRSSTQTG